MPYELSMIASRVEHCMFVGYTYYCRDICDSIMAYYPSECLWEPWFRLWHWKWRIKHNKGVCVTNGCLGDVVKQEYVQKGE